MSEGDRSKTRLVFAEQFYYPDGWGGSQIPRDITVHLAQAGFDVCVICGSDQYAPVQGDPGPNPAAVGVRIVRLPRLLSGEIHKHKLLRQVWFYLLATPVLLSSHRPSMLLTQTNPPLLVPIAALAAMLRRIPLVIIAQDVYPEVMFAHGMSKAGGLPGRVLARVFAWAYRRARNVVALGRIMTERLVEKGVDPTRIKVISNWATGEEAIERGEGNELRGRWNLEGCFVILYSGNIGIAHDVETPIAAMPLVLKDAPHVRLVFIGKGSRLADAQRAAERHGVSHAVQFRPLVPTSQLPQSFGLAHIALVTLRGGFEGLVVPSKLLGYMARGVPTLYVGPRSDAEVMILESSGGCCFRNGDAEGVAQTVLTLAADAGALAAMGEAAARHYEGHLSRIHGLCRYEDMVQSICVDTQTSG